MLSALHNLPGNAGLLGESLVGVGVVCVHKNRWIDKAALEVGFGEDGEIFIMVIRLGKPVVIYRTPRTA